MEEDHEPQYGLPANADADDDTVFRTFEAQLQDEGRKHTAGPPDNRFASALIAGVFVHDRDVLAGSLGPSEEPRGPGRLLTPLFETQFEQVSLWRPRGEQRWHLVTSVSAAVKSEDWWKTVASCLRLALAFGTRAEVIPALELFWLQDFDPAKPIDEHVLYGIEGSPPHMLEGGRGLTLDDILQIVGVVDALVRDDKFYAAVQHFVSAIQNHPVCLHCLLGGPSLPKHHHDEPELWEVADWVPSMEVAIVQATKSCEALLGQPGRNTEAAHNRWVSAITLDPNKQFDQTGMTYFEFYCDLFGDHRDGAAHGNEGFRYHVRRRDCLRTLVLAWRVIQGRYRRIAAPRDEVEVRLRVSPALLPSGT